MKAYVLTMFGLWVATVVGWIMNIIDLVHTSFTPLTAIAVLRVVGIFIFPLGAVLGIFT